MIDIQATLGRELFRVNGFHLTVGVVIAIVIVIYLVYRFKR